MRLCELLVDMKWHPLDEIVREAGKVITPGKAMRKMEKQRLSSPRAPAQRKYFREEHRQIESGKRALVRETLFGHYWENAVIDGVRSVRMVEVPIRVSREWARLRLLKGDLIAELGKLDDPTELLSLITQEQLFEVAVELAKRERERVLSARLLGH
jgi:hypothetical protein